MKAPKEIFVNFKQKVFTADERFAKGYYDRPYTKYLSEESVKEMLAEKDRRINNLLERIKFRDDQIDIDANSILSMNADLKAKDKEIERLKAINKEAYNNGYANGQLDLIRD